MVSGDDCFELVVGRVQQAKDALYAEGSLATIKVTIIILDLRSFMMVTGRVVVSRGEMESPAYPARDEVMGVIRKRILWRSEEGQLGHRGWFLREHRLLSQLENEGNDSLHHPCQCLDLVDETEEHLCGDNGMSDAGIGRQLPFEFEGIVDSGYLLSEIFIGVARLQALLQHRAILAPKMLYNFIS
ncbi:hypothetical protein GW17_00016172 [Ensete ventricosum]|nr:hypothetical protein GW17_00016172 [Ensete ventricosum]